MMQLQCLMGTVENKHHFGSDTKASNEHPLCLRITSDLCEPVCVVRRLETGCT